MKKKLLLVIALIAVITTSVLVFAACGSAPVQGQLSDIFLSDEHFEYKVTQIFDESNPSAFTTGTYVVNVKSYQKGSDVVLGSKTYTNVPAGYLVSGELNINGDEVKTQSYFRMVEKMKYVSSYATYRYQSIGGETFQYDGQYDGHTLNYTKVVNGGDAIKGSLSANEPFYDNNILHQLLRTISTYSAQMQFQFNIPSVSIQQDSVQKVTLLVAGAKKIKTPYTESLATSDEAYKDGVNCYACALNVVAPVNGMIQEYYLAEKPIKVNGWDVSHVIYKIVEPTHLKDAAGNLKKGSVTYELTNITIPSVG